MIALVYLLNTSRNSHSRGSGSYTCAGRWSWVRSLHQEGNGLRCIWLSHGLGWASSWSFNM